MAQLTVGNIYVNGLNQDDLYKILYNINDSFVTLLAKLDADATLTSNDYSVVFAVNFPSKDITPTGISKEAVDTFLQSLTTQFNLLLTKLDDDDGVFTNYHHLPVSQIVNPIGFINHEIFSNGQYQGDLIWFLKHIITQIAALTAALDSSEGVGSTNYASSCNVTDVIYDTEYAG